MKNLLLFTLLLLQLAQADMGSIPFKKGAKITEPRQDAIIAWNGKEQLLYLQTTLAASAETKILEVMPLPNKPTVTKADPGVFKRCAFHMPRRRANRGKGDRDDPFGDPGALPAAEVVDRKLIGAHDLRTVKLLDAKKFAAWIAKEFTHEGKPLHVPPSLLKVIDEYAQDGFEWFLFDVVDVAKHKAKKTPLKIRFKTDHLYYPMRITRTEKGHTTVSLAVITNVLFTKKDCLGIPRDEITVPAVPIALSGDRVRFIDPPIFELLGNPFEAKLRTWEISGQIDTFKKDLLIRNPAAQ
ncbi:MAG: DUF2330 domain-containing protein [Akkermansiaceae bacterium]